MISAAIAVNFSSRFLGEHLGTDHLGWMISAKISADSSAQEFVVRNDCPCGSTIGPIISTATGMRCVDVGVAQAASPGRDAFHDARRIIVHRPMRCLASAFMLTFDPLVIDALDPRDDGRG